MDWQECKRGWLTTNGLPLPGNLSWKAQVDYLKSLVLADPYREGTGQLLLPGLESYVAPKDKFYSVIERQIHNIRGFEPDRPIHWDLSEDDELSIEEVAEFCAALYLGVFRAVERDELIDPRIPELLGISTEPREYVD